MARPKKTGFDYFPFDVDLFEDYKVRKLMRHQGVQAVAAYALLLCNIYRNGYYLRWDEELPFFMSETLGLKEAYIAEVISYCASIGLIDREIYEKEKVLTSAGIQKRYMFICQQARRASVIDEYSLVSSEETPVSSEKTPVIAEETPVSSTKTPVSSEKSTQRKEKKRKENLSLERNAQAREGESERDREIDFEKFKDFFNYYVVYHRSAIKQVVRMPEERKQALASLLQDGYSKEDLQTVITKATASPQLNGRGKNSFVNIPSFDWIFKPENFVRILEGCFDAKQ